MHSAGDISAAAVQPQQTNCWCAVASTRAMLESIDASISVAQTDVNNYMTTHDKNDWTDPSFADYMQCAKGSPNPSYPHDARGMAWALWNWATPDQSAGYNDYESTNQSAMDWRIVRGIRATGDPVGAIVVHGEHAILVVGYQTALDPLNENGQNNQIMGMLVWDPWYNAGFGNWSGWPAGGFAPNSYVTLSDWNTKYFTNDRNEGPYFQGQYIAVLRSSVADAPSDTPAQDFGSAKYAEAGGGTGSTASPAPSDTPQASSTSADSSVAADTMPPAAPAALAATAADSATIAGAVASGLSAYGLIGNPDLGDVPANYTIGTTVHVRSLAVGVPSYDLVELRVGDLVKAVALVDEVSGAYRFGELRATFGDVRLPSATQLTSALATNGLGGSASLSWTWTNDPVPPFQPFLTGLDAAGKTAFVTPNGVTEQLPVVNGVTSTAN